MRLILTIVIALTTFVFQSVANPNYFSELVDFDCEKATIDMHFDHIRAIKDCLNTQLNLIQKAWDKLKADGKVSSTPQLKDKLKTINEIYNNIASDYINQYKKLPKIPTNEQWAEWKVKYVKWVNIRNNYLTETIRLFNNEIISQGGHLNNTPKPTQKQHYDEEQTWAVLEDGCPKARANMSFKRIQLIHECLIELGTLLKTRFNSLKDMGKITPAMEFAIEPGEKEFNEQNDYYADRYNQINESDNRQSLNALYAEWCNYIRNHYKQRLRFIKHVADTDLEQPSTMGDKGSMGKIGDQNQTNGFQKLKGEKTKAKADKEGKKEDKKNSTNNNEGGIEYYDSSKEFKGYNIGP